MQNEIAPTETHAGEAGPAERAPLLEIEVVELADQNEHAADVVFYRTTCTTCSTS